MIQNGSNWFDLPGIDSETIENPDRLDRRDDPFYGISVSNVSTILKDPNDFVQLARSHTPCFAQLNCI